MQQRRRPVAASSDTPLRSDARDKLNGLVSKPLEVSLSQPSVAAPSLSAVARRGAARIPSSLPVTGKPSRTTSAPPSSLSSLRSPSQPLPSTSAVPSPPASAHNLFGSPARPVKKCPVCKVDQSNLSQHFNTQACGQNLSDPFAEIFGYQRCSFSGCVKWVHSSRYASHLAKHMEDLPPTQVIDVAPRGSSSPHVSPPVSPVIVPRTP
jgi:hypothetical protein